ncbi:unnamed protein product [Prorocentrum cordatum]|uniref:Protein kinase domain-containing protein n=1 Tax=Prorocentrum cordatum TaxID=2364126 RepID=A0ABN9TAE8_9DINO|nr:unnamed protein product [Polarella glacialis]
MARSAAPRQRGGECGAVAQDGAGAQAWLETRLRGLSEDDFDGSIRIFCTSNLEPPEAFRDVWHAVPEELGLDEGLPLLSDKDAAGLNTVLIFCNPTRSSEVRRLSEIITNIDVHSTNAPPMFWVPHSVAPDRRGQNFSDLVPPDIVRELLHKGLDGIVSGEPAGTALSISKRKVLVKICKSANLSRRLNDMVSEGHVRTQHAQYLQQCAQDAVWGFAATRLAPDFPPVDDTLQPGLLQDCHAYTVGNKLGEGKLGSVYRLTESPEAGMNVYALKMVPKSARIRNLQLVQNMTRVMTVLSDERWRHPNITRLYQTHHTPTHILFRLEYGGPENLYHRLQDRRRPLALDDAAAVVAQVVEAAWHMHAVVQICHRDIKPENTHHFSYVVELKMKAPLTEGFRDGDNFKVMAVGLGTEFIEDDVLAETFSKVLNSTYWGGKELPGELLIQVHGEDDSTRQIEYQYNNEKLSMSQKNYKEEDDYLPGVQGRLWNTCRSICVLITVLGMSSFSMTGMNNYLVQVKGTTKEKSDMKVRSICVLIKILGMISYIVQIMNNYILMVKGTTEKMKNYMGWPNCGLPINFGQELRMWDDTESISKRFSTTSIIQYAEEFHYEICMSETIV